MRDLTAEANEARLNQSFALPRLEKQSVASLLLRITVEDEIDRLRLVSEGVVPALEAGV